MTDKKQMTDEDIFALVGSVPERPIDIDPKLFGDVLNKILEISSTSNGVKLSDLSLICPKEIPSNIEGLLMYGSKPWDAIYAILSEQQSKVKFTQPSSEVMKSQSLRDKLIAQGYLLVKIHIFFILATGRHPKNAANTASFQPMPELIKTYFSYTKSEGELADSLANFPLEKINTNMFQFLNLSKIENIPTANIAKRDAGYRFIYTLVIFSPISKAPKEAIEARDWIIKYFDKGNNIDFFPLNNQSELTQIIEGFERNFHNLLLKLYSTNQIKKMQQLKLISSIPVESPGDEEWKNWSKTITAPADSAAI